MFDKVTGQKTSWWLRPFSKWAQRRVNRMEDKRDMATEREMRRSASAGNLLQSQGLLMTPMAHKWQGSGGAPEPEEDLPGMNKLVMSARNTPNSSTTRLNFGPGAMQPPSYVSRDAVVPYRP